MDSEIFGKGNCNARSSARVDFYFVPATDCASAALHWSLTLPILFRMQLRSLPGQLSALSSVGSRGPPDLSAGRDDIQAYAMQRSNDEALRGHSWRNKGGSRTPVLVRMTGPSRAIAAAYSATPS